MRKGRPVPTYTETVSVRLAPAEAKRLYEMAVAGRRTLSQTLRILLEPLLFQAFDQQKQPVQHVVRDGSGSSVADARPALSFEWFRKCE